MKPLQLIKQCQQRPGITKGITIIFLLVAAFILYAQSSPPKTLNPFTLSFWMTPDQHGDYLMRKERFEEASRKYRNPLKAGIALFRNGQFEKAAGYFSQVNTDVGHFNRGNSLVMLGQYQSALEAYDRALELRTDWPDALTNRHIAVLRAEMVKKEGGEMTGGKLAADEFVFSKGTKNGQDNQDEVETEGGQELSDEALQALWLRRIETRPADFLKVKFAMQSQQVEKP